MSFFLLPNVPLHNNIEKLFNVSYFNLTNDVNARINKTLYSYLKTIKERIEYKMLVWDQYKKFTNPYEYIHSHIPNTSQSVCKINPLSRSFFKMIELIHMFELFEGLPTNCTTFHLAEGPGGFIEATSYLRQCKNDKYYGMTLINDDDQNVPGWKKTRQFLNNNPNVIIEKGIDGTGNLMKSENLKNCYEKFNGSIDFITADGGFDFSSDFNNQELISSKLLFSQIAFAFAMQKKGGNFVIKFFDTFTKSSVDMIYFLSMVYNKVYFVKPNTSRYTNSEKYIVCKDFRIDNRDKIVLKLIEIMDSFNKNEDMFIEKLFTMDIPYYFVNKMEEYNAIVGQHQIENIFATLSMINNNKYNNHFYEMKNIHIQKCIGWCKKYKLPYNKINNYGSFVNSNTNMFYHKNNHKMITNTEMTNVIIDDDDIADEHDVCDDIEVCHADDDDIADDDIPEDICEDDTIEENVN